MPYIPQEDRARIAAESLSGILEPQTPGELNYLVTVLCTNYLDVFGRSYTNFNAVVGALECVKLELYRRRIAPYEDNKIEENGDVGSRE